MATEVGAYNPVYQNIHLKDITVSNAQEGLIIWGIPESPIQQIEFENVKISAKHGAQIYNAKAVVFRGCALEVAEGARLRVYNAGIRGLK